MFKNTPTSKCYDIGSFGKIIHLNYEHQYELCSSFMRLQEFYESDIESIKGKFFTLEEYMDAYAERMGNFSYTLDWSGFNIPSTSFYEWYDVFKAMPMLNKEYRLLDNIKEHVDIYRNTNEKFYLIGTYGTSEKYISVLSHEISHALYSLDPSYKEHQNFNISKFQENNKESYEGVLTKLKSMGYAEHVLLDEVQAYFSTSVKESLLNKFNVDENCGVDIFKHTFEHYTKKHGILCG